MFHSESLPALSALRTPMFRSESQVEGSKGAGPHEGEG